MARMATIASRAESLLGTAVVSTTPVAGGDICTATRLRLSDGRSAVIKTRPHAPPDFFAAEGRGLAWLAQAGGARIPEVLGYAEDCLIVTWVETGHSSTDAAESLGRKLAATHAAGAESFGAPEDGYIGTVPLPNKPADSWPEFYATRRVLPYLKVAYDRGSATDEDVEVIEALLRRIDEVAGPSEPPARLHGDLWSGNILWGTDGEARLIDPAAHGGHRETDLAMLALFGAPHLSRLLHAYDEVSPLSEGWRERVALHQLHPLLVHAVLFGGGYAARAAAAARAALDGTAADDT
ncbi:MAG: phosphotransferase [Propionibacteriales bacterium]|nr:phosphotransferase [Propionibacteriales bacterium]